MLLRLLKRTVLSNSATRWRYRTMNRTENSSKVIQVYFTDWGVTGGWEVAG